MPILCSFLHVVEPALAVLAGAAILGPLIALHALHVLRGALRWWGGTPGEARIAR
jgi:hypothetical protein